MLKWLRQRKLEKLEMRLAGFKAALSYFADGWIAHDAAIVEYKIAKLKEKLCK